MSKCTITNGNNKQNLLCYGNYQFNLQVYTKLRLFIFCFSLLVSHFNYQNHQSKTEEIAMIEIHNNSNNLKFQEFQQHRFFTIHKDQNIKLPNIFQGQQMIQQDVIISSRKYDVVGFNIVNKFLQKQNKMKKKSVKNLNFQYQTLLSTKKQQQGIAKEFLIQQLERLDTNIVKTQPKTTFSRSKRLFESTQSLWKKDDILIRKRIGTKQTMNKKIKNFRSNMEKKVLFTYQEQKSHISPQLWKSTLCCQNSLKTLFKKKEVERIDSSPQHLVIKGRDKLRQQKQWLKRHSFSVFTKQKNCKKVRNQQNEPLLQFPKKI